MSTNIIKKQDNSPLHQNLSSTTPWQQQSSMQTWLIMRTTHLRVFAAGKETLNRYADPWDGKNVMSNVS